MAKAQVQDNADDKDSFVDELKPGTKLMHGQYTIESFLNAGGFGITYLAKDSLDRKIVIKECFPGAFCRRSRYVVQARSRAHQNELKSIVRLFVQEARSLAKLDHPNIVGVHQVFEDNDTAYMALDFVEGRDLLDTIEDPSTKLTPPQIKNILKEVLGAVGFIHDQGILHRDISPDNILINQDLHPVLIDFGAAREEATKQSRVLSALRVVKDGYSPQEFYIAGSEQSPSSDLYALAASFYHLINGDVPPNSQARLAAIASGDTDPYVPLSGRFPDYEDNFLAAIDKALAVLPKDRLQSAKDWIDMMEGNSGNVTALNVAPAATAAAAPEVAEPVEAKKSKLPLLLGSAAAVALLVGVGVLTMTGGSEDTNATADATPQPTATVPVETAAAPAAPAVEEPAPVAETPAPVEEEPTELAVAEPAVTEPAPEVVEEPAPLVVEEPTPVIPEATGPVVVEIPGPVVVEDPAPVVVETPTPEIVGEPAPVIAGDPAPIVEGPVIIDEPTPTIRPSARPESVELAAVPEPEPLPEPVATPQPVADASAATAALPDVTANRPVADGDTAQVDLPSAPDVVAAVGTGPSVEIDAVTPGNELIPEPEGVAASWTVQLPFSAAGDQSNIIAQAAAVSPVWVQPGLVITSINGTPVGAISDIPTVLNQTVPISDLEATLPVTFGTLNPASGEQVEESWVLPVIQQLELLNGVAFETTFAGNEWRTVVAELPETLTGGLEVGDVMRSYIPTAELIQEQDSLQTILERELSVGTDQFMFAVERDGGMWVASLNYDGVEE
ncbi:serine/threonine-protein kinase [Cognatiyoonia sp. IB215182]|uniref:serine/threonine-protein kinase n=1 Tax=Cognatiyoonia sp. IB215182 TaxID=3097353 RepID=UPI002A0AD140|nr:protein kinase [Cognatiyoonia sp. IB215182]MDX8352637.1 protein kinase [Cognatiyoonia sp. IB215182]